MNQTTLKLNVDELAQFLEAHFPQAGSGRAIRIEAVEPMRGRIRLLYHDRHLRPGGTISGPSLMMLADTAMYLTLLAMIGSVALAVTTNLNINFLKKPPQADVLADCLLLKLGKRLAVGEVTMHSETDPEPVAHATVTYSIPPER